VAAGACLVVTDDYPQFIVPAQIRAVARAVDVAVHAVDGNGMVPLALLGPPTGAAAHLRPKLHKLFADAWKHRAEAEPDFPVFARRHVNPPFRPWTPPADLDEFVAGLPIDQTVPPVPDLDLGPSAGQAALAEFVAKKLPRYGTERNNPDDPDRTAASGLSAFLRHGHLGIQDVCEAVLGPDWTPAEINPKTRNKDDFFCRDASINGFLDEAITWRDVGYQWSYAKNVALGAAGGTRSWADATDEMPSFHFGTFDFSPLPEAGTLPGVLPPWAWASLQKHAGDRRTHLYSVEQFENADTHDDLWNAAQRQLVATGRIHNYLRMLWGKKVLEWSEFPEAAYRVLEHLNNKYAIDGRDPNSYTGILWCFGLFDRPWPPERDVFGSVRFMSSDNTGKKFDLSGYREYVATLGGKAKTSYG
ncbi:MAG: deoxyribodipyrimidine photolyase, partial [Fimbriiglobus sp.]